ncbi:hypothetical protein A6A04_08875 [Paramagnetospirillum marisnigri]|uniref:Methyl-accepting transducer domain-containing protein n=1 Tax=Paramagnetospirillum marisnigri TaxID=1285242 RepID=A0A178M7G9_9PROT|nr:hypothetical protein [Paramagnetospirillum marisnigri]OAN43985.1 hypothetical protein A6A04_08875 [Paramagnetospirillum marisnigri]
MIETFEGSSGDGDAVWRNSLHDQAGRTSDLYANCVGAYHAFDSLPRLVEGLRLLSINAGLVSARAGDYGRSVRVLTHFATESVVRLHEAVPKMLALKRDTYETAAGVMRAINDIGKLEAAGTLILRNSGPEAAALIRMGAAWRSRVQHLGRAAGHLAATNDQLVAMVKVAREVMLQTELIAANIAIEATSAGPWEAELTAIADTIREKVDELRTMVDEAGRRLRNATETIVGLVAFGHRTQ